GSVRVYDPATAGLLSVLTPHTDEVLSVALGTLTRSPRSARQCVSRRTEPMVRSLRSLTPDGAGVIVSGGADGTGRVWAARTAWPLLCLPGHTGPVTAVAFGHVAGRAVVASGGSDRTVRLWDA